MSGCLANCSNQGQCQLDSLTQKLICQCQGNYSGSSCQTNLLPCSQVTCLNNGTCSNVFNESISNESNYTFLCKCQSNSYGQYCENQVNLCLNVNCSSQGYCSQGECKCFYSFYGDHCELASTLKKVVSYVQITSLIILLFSSATLVFLIIFNDLANFTMCKKNKKQPQSITHKVIAHAIYYDWPKEKAIVKLK